VALEDGGEAAPQRVDVQRPVDVDDELHRVHVDAAIGQPRQREQSFLQRAQRQDVLDLRGGHARSFQVAVSAANWSGFKPEALIGA